MDTDTITALLTALHLQTYVPLALALVGVASVISTVYPATAPGANFVHALALLLRNAKPATPAAPASTTVTKAAPMLMLASLLGLSACGSATIPAATLGASIVGAAPAVLNAVNAAAVADVDAVACAKDAPTIKNVTVGAALKLATDPACITALQALVNADAAAASAVVAFK